MQYLSVHGGSMPSPADENFWRCTADGQRAATMRIVIEECEIPAKVMASVPFTMKYVYQFGEKLERHTARSSTGGEATPVPVDELFPEQDFHGSFRWFYFHQSWGWHDWWTWKAIAMYAYHNEERIGHHGVDVKGQKFTYTWTGTIEELTGRQFPQPEIVTDRFDITGALFGFFGREAWPYSWEVTTNWFQERPVHTVEYNIEVEPYQAPPPPNPIFDADYCSISKTTVAPNEQFTINLRIRNTNDSSGPYSLWTLCEGHDRQLGTGNIGPNQTINRSFTVTPNQIFGSEITQDRYLYFSAKVRNEEGVTDTWPAPTIAVIVPVNGDKATLSGRVTDKATGFSIPNASVSTVGRTVYTDGAGNYSIENLDTGYYEITFKKSGYHDEKRSKLLNAGSNTLNVAMTPTTEPPPGEGEFPWAMVSGGVAILAIGLMLARKGKGGAK